MLTLALIDTHEGGHHLMYLRSIGKALLEMGHQVIIFYPDPYPLVSWLTTECPEHAHRFKVQLAQDPEPATLPILGTKLQPVNVLNRWCHAATLAKAVRAETGKAPDLVFFNWLDDLLSAHTPPQLIDWLFPYPWVGLCFKPRLSFQPDPEPSPLPNRYHRILNAGYCQGVGVLDQGMATLLQRQLNHPVFTFPDFTDESEPDAEFQLVQHIRQQAQGRKIVALLGSLNKRKGLLTLLKVALKSQEDNYFFVFVGELSIYNMSLEEQAWVQQIATSPPANCFFHLARIPDEPQFNALVNISDVIFAAYERFPYSSNLLTKAAVFQKPVIASRGFCMGNRVEQFRLGVTISEGDVDQCIAALQKIGADLPTGDTQASLLGATQHQPDFVGYHQQNSIAQLKIALQEMLAPCLMC